MRFLLYAAIAGLAALLILPWGTAVASKTSELIWGLYDDFDGNGCGGTAIEGGLNMDNWSWYNGTGEVVRLDTIGPKRPRGIDLLAPDAADLLNALPLRQFKDLRPPRRPSGRAKPHDWQPNPSGYVVKMEREAAGDLRLELMNPMPIYFDEFMSVSFDVMYSSETTKIWSTVGLDHHFRLARLGTSSYLTGIYLAKWDYADYLSIVAQVTEKNTGFNENVGTGAEYDTWYNLRQDIVKISETELRFDFFVNGELLWSMTPPYSDLLLDPSEINFGPIRNFCVYSTATEGKIVGYVDNVRAVYELPGG